MEAIKSNCNITFSCKYHVVWCSKYRRPVLVSEVDVRLKEIIAEVCVETASELLEWR
jgi:putative transposase